MNRVKGFTLIEALLALLIISLVMTSSMYIINQTSKTFQYSEKMFFSMLEAENVLVQYRLGLIMFPKGTYKMYQPYKAHDGTNQKWEIIRSKNKILVRLFNLDNHLLYEREFYEAT